MNAPVADFVFRRIAAPKGGGYFEANKQFIAPLPIPDAPEADRADVAARAERLQGLHSERRDLLAEIGRRMSVVPLRAALTTWLSSRSPALAHLDGKAPAHLDCTERLAWANKEREEAAEWLARPPRREPSPRSIDGRALRGRRTALLHRRRADHRARLPAPRPRRPCPREWKLVASSFAITDSTTGKKLADALRKVALTAPDAVREQIIDRELALSAVEAEIDLAEAEMNARVYQGSHADARRAEPRGGGIYSSHSSIFNASPGPAHTGMSADSTLSEEDEGRRCRTAVGHLRPSSALAGGDRVVVSRTMQPLPARKGPTR